MNKNKKAFTLIEILVAIAIIGILATVLMANFQGLRERARDSQRKKDLNEIKTALRLFYNDNQSFPANTSSSHATLPNRITCEITTPTTIINWGEAFVCNGTTYMSQLPAEPLEGNSEYFYGQEANGEGFTLYTCLENEADPQRDSTNNCGTGYASYTVSQE